MLVPEALSLPVSPLAPGQVQLHVDLCRFSSTSVVGRPVGRCASDQLFSYPLVAVFFCVLPPAPVCPSVWTNAQLKRERSVTMD